MADLRPQKLAHLQNYAFSFSIAVASEILLISLACLNYGKENQ